MVDTIPFRFSGAVKDCSAISQLGSNTIDVHYLGTSTVKRCQRVAGSILSSDSQLVAMQEDEVGGIKNNVRMLLSNLNKSEWTHKKR